MVPKFKFFQANFLATLLRSAALAIAFLMSASPARAEVVTLVCQQEPGQYMTVSGGSFTLRVDYDRKIVDFLQSDGTVSYSAAATITEGDVKWGGQEDIFRGNLNRLSGVGFVGLPDLQNNIRQMSGPCRRATQKF